MAMSTENTVTKKEEQHGQLDRSEQHAASKTENGRAALKVLLQQPGSLTDIKPMHVYTIKHIDVKKETPVRHLQKLLHDQVFTKLIPAACVKVNSATYIAFDEIKLVDAQDHEFNAKVVVVRTRLIDAEYATLRSPQNANCRVEDGFTNVYDGRRADGMLSRRWVRFDGAAVLAADYSGLENFSSLEKEGQRIELVKKALKLYSMSDHTVPDEDPESPLAERVFAIWFEHETVQLDDPLTIVRECHNTARQQQLDAAIAVTLRGVLEQYGEAREGIVMHGKKAFSTLRSVLPSGLVERMGLRGGLILNSEDGSVALSYRPCTGRFFDDNQTVAMFLVSYFGHEKASNPDFVTLEKMNNLLRGTRVIISVKDGFRKQTAVILSMGTNAVDKLESLKGLKGNVSLADLRYPRMPCVDVGDSRRPFYIPAELCQIAPNQMFHGDIPAVDRAQRYALRTAKDASDYEPRTSNPFKEVNGDDFRIIFVNLTDAAAHDGDEGSSILRPEIWATFQCEVGERFDAKFRKTVTMATKSQLQYDDVNTTLVHIARITSGVKGSKTVLVMAIPKSFPSDAASAVKAYCEAVVGVQCCFVSYAELAKRYHPLTSITMVHYTGQLVRKILGRFNIPGQMHNGDEQKSLDKSSEDDLKDKDHCRLYGIHVVNMKDFRQIDSDKHAGLNVSMYRLVTIVSVSSRRPETDLHTTHSAVKIEHDVQSGETTLAQEVAQCLMEHARKTRKDGMNKVAIYCSGVETKSNHYNDDLGTAIDRSISHLLDAKITKAKSKPVQLTIMAPHHQVKMKSAALSLDMAATENSAENAIEQYWLNTGGKDANKKYPDSNTDFNLHHLTLSQIYRQPDGFRKHGGSLKETSKVWYVVRRRFNPNGTFHFLERRHLPDILYLAQAASKRGQAHVYLQLEKDKSKGIAQEWSYGVTPVHKNLQNMLYFI